MRWSPNDGTGFLPKYWRVLKSGGQFVRWISTGPKTLYFGPGQPSSSGYLETHTAWDMLAAGPEGRNWLILGFVVPP
jgi:hypothetical protein